MKQELCANCCARPKSFGEFCQSCLRNMKEDKKREKENEAYQRAVAFGAGDLWRLR